GREEEDEHPAVRRVLVVPNLPLRGLRERIVLVFREDLQRIELAASLVIGFASCVGALPEKIGLLEDEWSPGLVLANRVHIREVELLPRRRAGASIDREALLGLEIADRRLGRGAVRSIDRAGIFSECRQHRLDRAGAPYVAPERVRMKVFPHVDVAN